MIVCWAEPLQRSFIVHKCDNDLIVVSCVLLPYHNEVAIVDRMPAGEFANTITHITRGMLLFELDRLGVKRYGDNDLRFIDDDGVHIMDRNWKETVLEADYVVNALGVKSVHDDAWCELVPEVYYVGDAYQIGTIYSANHRALDVAYYL